MLQASLNSIFKHKTRARPQSSTAVTYYMELYIKYIQIYGITSVYIGERKPGTGRYELKTTDSCFPFDISKCRYILVMKMQGRGGRVAPGCKAEGLRYLFIYLMTPVRGVTTRGINPLYQHSPRPGPSLPGSDSPAPKWLRAPLGERPGGGVQE